jgi:uncharacterized protein YfiM (DUF2279 family)
MLKIIFVIICFLPSGIISQVNDSVKVNSQTIHKALAYTSVYYAASFVILSNTWYKDRQIVPFHFYNDNRAYHQVDKLGHAFGAYVYSYAGYHYLMNAGFTRTEALCFGATLGLLLQTPIEIMDGIHEGYGFSWGDIAANTLGSAIVFGQELLFNEQVVKYKFSYWESKYSKTSNNYLGKTSMERLLKDYNGHTYWLSFPLSRLLNYQFIPSWFNIAVGYGADGMYGEFENVTSYNGINIPETRRYKQYLLSFDIDWSRIETNSNIMNIILKGIFFIKLPFPALEFNSKGKIQGYWLYF